MLRARFAAAISDFDGTQPVLRQSPPILAFSTSTTGTPKAAAAAATDSPPEPPPMTQMSGRRSSTMPFPDSAEAVLARRAGPVRAPAFHQYRDQREHAEQRHRGQQFQ